MNGCEGVQAVHGRPSCLGGLQARLNYIQVSRSYRAVNKCRLLMKTKQNFKDQIRTAQ